MNYSIDQYLYFILLLLIPLFGWMGIDYLRWRKKKQQIFVSSRFRDRMLGTERGIGHYFWFFAVFFLAIFSLILSIVNIVGGSKNMEIQQKTGNLIFAIDVSNSMNAEDVSPSRLERGKNIIIHSLSRFGTDRVGLIIFAGRAKSIMPLTTDYASAESYIGAIETSAIRTQGTDFLSAVEEAVEKFRPIDKNGRHLVLISDGEDNEGNVDAAIQLAKKQNITVTTIGIGTEEGAPIPYYLYGQLMGYKYDNYGETVISRRQTLALEKIARQTGGRYIDGNTLEDAVNELSHFNQSRSKEGTFIQVSSDALEQYYQYPLLVAFLLFYSLLLFNPKRSFNL